jgi:hypothetical protein
MGCLRDFDGEQVPVRIANGLLNLGCKTWHDVASLDWSDLANAYNLGKKSRTEIEGLLTKKGFCAPRRPQPPPPSPEQIERRNQRELAWAQILRDRGWTVVPPSQKPLDTNASNVAGMPHPSGRAPGRGDPST